MKIKDLLRNFEKKWCNMLGFFNPYVDPFDIWFSPDIPINDVVAFNKTPDHRYLYDKLWVAKSQGLKCGELANFNKAKFPIFIKPRWGHKTSSSRNCYKINNFLQLKPFLSKKDMMWSEFVSDNEQMTDFVLVNGQVVHQITYTYSESVDGISDKWKFISPDNKPPYEVTKWTTNNLREYTGVVNVQYRGNKIIEVGLRLARGGAYLLSAQNYELINSINQLYTKNEWNFSNKDYNFKPFYAFKCYLKGPLLYVFPQYIMDFIMRKFNCMPFYEYYFEANGKNKLCFFQFMHNNFNTGEAVLL